MKSNLFNQQVELFNPKTLSEWSQIDPSGWEDIVNDLLEIFLRTVPVTYDSLLEAVEKGDWAQVRAHAHSLKSSCGNVGAEKANVLFAELERRATAGDVQGIDELLAALDRALDQTMPIILSRKKSRQAA